MRLMIASSLLGIVAISQGTAWSLDRTGYSADTGRPDLTGVFPPQRDDPARIQFGIGWMTDQRARRIAEAAGFDYLRWYTCAGNPDGCMVLEVAGPAGNIFQYHLLDTACDGSAPTDRSAEAAVLLDPLTRPRPEAERRAAPEGRDRRSASERRASSTPRLGSPSAPVQAESSPSPLAVTLWRAQRCFGGYVALARTRQESTFLADNLGFFQSLSQTVQIMDGGRWTPVIELDLDAWQVPVGSLTERGHAYTAVLPSTGETVAAGGYSYQFIAGTGGSTDVSLAERCEAKRDVYQAQSNAVIENFNAACVAGEWILPDSINLEGAFSPAGVGGTLSGSWEFPFCEPVTRTMHAQNALSAAEMYEDCLSNPGRYFPGSYPPVVQPLILDEASGYLPLVPEEITIAGDCRPYTTQITSFAIGSLSCTIATPYTCEEKNDECICTKDERIGSHVETVCTEG